jgi:hypothetical protein
LSGSFPNKFDDLKINNDLDNRAHGPHFDILQSIPGGTDQIRVNSDGDILGGTTNIGKTKLDW